MRTLTPLSLLTIHRAPLWLSRGRCRTTAGNSEVGRQGIWCTQGHPPHVFGPELLSPWGSTAEVLIIILEYDEVRKKKKGGGRQKMFLVHRYSNCYLAESTSQQMSVFVTSSILLSVPIASRLLYSRSRVARAYRGRKRRRMRLTEDLGADLHCPHPPVCWAADLKWTLVPTKSLVSVIKTHFVQLPFSCNFLYNYALSDVNLRSLMSGWHQHCSYTWSTVPLISMAWQKTKTPSCK